MSKIELPAIAETNPEVFRALCEAYGLDAADVIERAGREAVESVVEAQFD